MDCIVNLLMKKKKNDNLYLTTFILNIIHCKKFKICIKKIVNMLTHLEYFYFFILLKSQLHYITYTISNIDIT
jgi:hypothetical protein